jgi:hypothetical protein
MFMLVTECGLTDRFKAEFPGKQIVGTCILCPYMKEIQLDDVLKALKDPAPEQFIEIPADVAERARASLERMFELEKQGNLILQKRDGSSFAPVHDNAPEWSSNPTFLARWAASTPTNVQNRRKKP